MKGWVRGRVEWVGESERRGVTYLCGNDTMRGLMYLVRREGGMIL